MLYLSSITLIIIGIIILNSKEWIVRGLVIDSSDNYFNIFLGIILIIFSFYLLFLKWKYKNHKLNNYTKCPKCKEIFESSDLENGKCKYCKDIETIDLDKYFELSPKELTKRKNKK